MTVERAEHIPPRVLANLEAHLGRDLTVHELLALMDDLA